MPSRGANPRSGARRASNVSISSWRNLKSMADDEEQFLSDVTFVHQQAVGNASLEELSQMKQRKFGQISGAEAILMKSKHSLEEVLSIQKVQLPKHKSKT